MISSSERHPAFEEYCECIFELHEDDLDVIRARIAERLNVSRASVSQMIEKMTKVGLVVSNDNTIALTAEGLALANQVVRRHRLARMRKSLRQCDEIKVRRSDDHDIVVLIVTHVRILPLTWPALALPRGLHYATRFADRRFAHRASSRAEHMERTEPLYRLARRSIDEEG